MAKRNIARNSKNQIQTRENEFMGNLTHAHYFLLAVLILVLLVCYNMMKPYLNPIILAFILSMVLHPIHIKIQRRVKGRENLAAFLSCILLTLVVILPLFFMTLAIVQQGIQTFHSITEWVTGAKYQVVLESPAVQKFLTMAGNYSSRLTTLFPDLDLKKIRIDKILLDASSAMGKAFIAHSGQIVGNITSVIGSFFLMLFAFFFIVRDQDIIFREIRHLLPLSSSQEGQIVSKIREVSKSALLGTLVTALAQGVAGGIAFWISGLPGLFWGTAMAFASLIPIVGTALIWVPAAGWLFISGHWGYGIFMVLWCAVVVGMIDNFVRPMFMKDSAGMSTLLIFFSILGGIQYFGLTGILYGPLVFGIALVILYIYSMEFADFLKQQDER